VEQQTAIPETFHPKLTASEMVLRDRFVKEYLQDYDAFRAAIRIGYTVPYAKEFSIRFMNEPYVLNKLRELETQPEDDYDEISQKKKIVSALWREANNQGSGSSQSARVAALSKLSAFYGMDAPSRSQAELTGKDGQPLGQGVFVVPGLVTAEEWAAQAEKQQQELVRPTVVTPNLKLA
jgi:hypothetical protein